MKMTIHVSGQCECGWYMLPSFQNTMHCPNPHCEHYGKNWKLPTIELEEA